MKKTIYSLLAIALLAVVSGAVAQDKHPLEDYFKAEILTEKAMKEVLVKAEIEHHVSPTPISVEVYHTDLEIKIVGLKVEVENPAAKLKYEAIIELEAMPYEKTDGSTYAFRADDLRDEGVTLKVIEIRYEELPDIDDMITEAKEEEEEEDKDE